MWTLPLIPIEPQAPSAPEEMARTRRIEGRRLGDGGKFLLRMFSRRFHYSGMTHLSDHDLERYHLGMVTDENELAALEEHYLGCPECATRAMEIAEFVDLFRASIIIGNFDLEIRNKSN